MAIPRRWAWRKKERQPLFFSYHWPSPGLLLERIEETGERTTSTSREGKQIETAGAGMEVPAAAIDESP